MKKRQISAGIELFYPPEEEETATIIEAACAHGIGVIGKAWGLEPPKRCRIYVMTSAPRFLFQAAPWYLWLPYLPLLPLWYLALRKHWKWAAGLTFRYDHCPVIGIKPPRLLAKSDLSVGRLIFVGEPDARKRIEHTVVHELTHAFAGRLRLPMWLNEGIAMVAVDQCLGQQTVRMETLQSLNHPRLRRLVSTYQDPDPDQKGNEAVVYNYVRGYWITRFLLDTHPEVIAEAFEKRRSHLQTERRLATALDIPLSALWNEIDDRVVNHFAGANGAHEKTVSHRDRHARRRFTIHSQVANEIAASGRWLQRWRVGRIGWQVITWVTTPIAYLGLVGATVGFLYWVCLFTRALAGSWQGMGLVCAAIVLLLWLFGRRAAAHLRRGVVAVDALLSVLGCLLSLMLNLWVFLGNAPQ